jgi:hypothetical protein
VKIDDSFWDILDDLRVAMNKVEDDLDKLAESCDNELKIAVTRWAMKHIVEHAKDGGSYRYLIYDRMGFGPEAYMPLCSDGLTISNEFDLGLKDQLVEVAKTEGYDKIKPLIGLCDEPGCYDYISCGWPTEDGGYRQTCSNHYHGKLKSEK